MPDISTATCSRCGEPIAAGAHFCPKCGADISGQQGQLTTMQMPMAQSAVEIAQADLLVSLREATIGEYDIMGELGRGGMATVYLAHDIALDRKVAVKIMSPQLLSGEGMSERFKREAKTAAQLSHPHIIPIYVVRETPKILFFVMKFVQGRGLDAIIKEKGPLPIKMIQAILTQVGGALGYAHRRGVVHRDIKPANIMIDEEGWAVVTDFGIAKVTEAKNLTMTGATVGTPYYMSPEQATAKNLTGMADQYSLGIVAYEMLSGKPPFVGETIMDIMRQHFFEPPPPLQTVRPDCPPTLATAVNRMLEKEAEKRFPTMEEAVAAIGTTHVGHDDPVHTQMVELAKSVLNLKPLPQFATPKSPIPASRPMRAMPAGAVSGPQDATVKMASTPPRLAPRAPKKSAKWPWVVVPLLAAAGVGGVVMLGDGGETGGGGTQAPAGNPGGAVDLQVSPASLSARVGEQPTVQALAFDAAGGRVQGVSVTWSSTDTAVVTVDQNGRARARAPGQASLIASLGSLRRVASVSVTPAPVQPPPQTTAQRQTQGQQTQTQRQTVTPPPVTPPPASGGTGSIKLGTRSDSPAVLFINGQPQGAISGLQDWPAPAGSVRVSIRISDACKWDSTVTVNANQNTRIGYRTPECE